ncbi:MAG: sigma-70 family RNA polymerase sigma factor [Bradyrhizobium sp.]
MVVVQIEDDEIARFNRLVVPHLSDALTIARWLTRNRADADDVLQESCIRAFRSIGQLRDENGRAWILAIVRNTAYTWLRKHRSKALVLVEDLAEQERIDAELGADRAGANDGNPETELIEQADAARLETAIQELPPHFREVLVLRDMQGLEYREIAQVIGAPVGTVMSRLARARQKLIQLLKAEQP